MDHRNAGGDGGRARPVTPDASRRESDLSWWGVMNDGGPWRGASIGANYKGADQDKAVVSGGGVQSSKMEVDEASATADGHIHGAVSAVVEAKKRDEVAEMEADKSAAAQHSMLKAEKPELKDKDRRLNSNSNNGNPKAPRGDVEPKERHKRDRDGNLIKSEDAGDHSMFDEAEAEKKPLGSSDDKMDVDRKEAGDHKVKQEEDSHADDLQGGEREKDAIVVQQRRRQVRPAPPRETRSKFRTKYRESFSGRLESNFVTYKIGEGLPDLLKLWKEHSEAGSSASGPTLEVRIPADLATTSNKQVRGSQLWGTDIYTDDSDLVAVLWHTGYYSPTGSPPPACILELRATIRVLAPQNGYKSTVRNSVRSRAWGAASGCSYSIERCCIVKNGGGIVDLEPSLNRTPVVAPTLAPAAMERTMTTRAASSNAHRQQRFVQEVTIQYNLCNEPWLKYSMSIVADRGLKKSQYTSARLKKGDVLYLETHTHRYELSYDGEKAACNGSAAATTATSVPPQATTSGKHSSNGDKNGTSGDVPAAEHYKWSRCKFPLPLSAVKVKGVPLPQDCIQVLEDGLLWDEVQWCPTGVWIRGKEFALARAQFLSPNVNEAGDA